MLGPNAFICAPTDALPRFLCETMNGAIRIPMFHALRDAKATICNLHARGVKLHGYSRQRTKSIMFMPDAWNHAHYDAPNPRMGSYDLQRRHIKLYNPEHARSTMHNLRFPCSMDEIAYLAIQIPTICEAPLVAPGDLRSSPRRS